MSLLGSSVTNVTALYEIPVPGKIFYLFFFSFFLSAVPQLRHLNATTVCMTFFKKWSLQFKDLKKTSRTKSPWRLHSRTVLNKLTLQSAIQCWSAPEQHTMPSGPAVQLLLSHLTNENTINSFISELEYSHTITYIPIFDHLKNKIEKCSVSLTVEEDTSYSESSCQPAHTHTYTRKRAHTHIHTHTMLVLS